MSLKKSKQKRSLVNSDRNNFMSEGFFYLTVIPLPYFYIIYMYMDMTIK